jgi:hypothetical protein
MPSKIVRTFVNCSGGTVSSVRLTRISTIHQYTSIPHNIYQCCSPSKTAIRDSSRGCQGSSQSVFGKPLLLCPSDPCSGRFSLQRDILIYQLDFRSDHTKLDSPSTCITSDVFGNVLLATSRVNFSNASSNFPSSTIKTRICIASSAFSTLS